AAVGKQEKLQLWDSTGSLMVGELDVPEGTAGGSFSTDSTKLVTSQDVRFTPHSCEIAVFDVERRSQLKKFQLSSNACVTFSPDGEKLLLCHQAQDYAKIIDIQTGKDVATFPHKTIWSARYSPDGRLVASGGGGITRVWDVETQELLTELN